MLEGLDRQIEKYGKKKIYLILFTFFMTLGLIVSFYVNYEINTMDYNGHTYKLDSLTNGKKTLVSKTGDPIYLDARRTISIMDSFSIEVDEDIYIIYRNDDMERVVELNGEVVSKTPFINFNDNKVTKMPDFIYDVIEVNNSKAVSQISYFIFFNLFLIGIGVLNLVNPEFSWHLRMMFITRGGEPTDFYITITRYGGIIFILLGTFIPFRFLWM